MSNEHPEADPNRPLATGGVPEAPPPPPGTAAAEAMQFAHGNSEGEPSKRGVLTWIIAGTAAVVLAAGAVFGVRALSGDDSTASAAAASTGADQQSSQAQNGDPAQNGGRPGRGPGTSGSITAIAGSTLTVETRSGSVKVTTTDDTQVTTTSDGTLADISVGDNVMVVGTTTTNTVTANRIIDRGDAADPTGQPPAGGQPPTGAQQPADGGQQPPSGGTRQGGGGPGVSGKVTAVNGESLTIETGDGTTYQVTASSSTTVTVQTTAKVSDLATGDQVVVRGETADDGTIAASAIREGAMFAGPGGGPGPMPGAGQNGTGTDPNGTTSSGSATPS